MKKHISALAYMAITFKMPLEYNSCRGVSLCKRSWECKGQICNLCYTKIRCSEGLPQKIFRINRSGSWNIIGHVFTTRQISLVSCCQTLVHAGALSLAVQAPRANRLWNSSQQLLVQLPSLW